MTQLQNNETMSSRQIAQIIGKPHSYILKSIRNMEYAWKKVNGGNFSLVEYKDGKGEMRPEYRLNKIECLYIATKFNNEARAKLVIRWAELEEKNTIALPPPRTYNGIKCIHYTSWLIQNNYSLTSSRVGARIRKYPEQFRKSGYGQWYMSEAIADYFLAFRDPQKRATELPSINPKQLKLF